MKLRTAKYGEFSHHKTTKIKTEREVK